MISDMLRVAREYEAAHKAEADAMRPAFHYTAPIGWINDPNGFSVYKNQYHLFSQYHPYTPEWGPMHWGHAVSNDFVKWEYLPAALAPDSDVDSEGCFSGDAIELEDGRQMLIYTGVYKVPGDRQTYQHQCVAFGDGVNYEKYENNPVISADTVPESCSKIDFRDPHIFKDGDTFYALLGNRPADGSGHLLVYESKDALHWSFKTILESNGNQYGRIWECPDFFELDGKYVITVSPQEMEAEGYEFHRGFGVVTLIGSFDKETFSFHREAVQATDYGIDFYAPQTLKTNDGRRVMIGWMENWQNSRGVINGSKLFGVMTLPRELSVKNGRLIQTPVREIENYYGEKTEYTNVEIAGETELAGIKGRRTDLTVSVKPEDTMYHTFSLEICADEAHGTKIEYSPETNIVKFDRTGNGGRFDVVHVREFKAFDHEGSIKFRVLIDRNQIELFVNDGEQAASFKLYDEIQDADGIRFFADAPVRVDVVKHDIDL